MKTIFKQTVSLRAGEIDTILQDGLFNDSADAVTGMTVISGSFWFPKGTSGALIYVRVSSVGGTPGVINQIEVQALANGLAKTVHTFSGLAINAPGLYVFEIAPSTTPSNFAGQLEGVMPSAGQLKITLATHANAISGSVSLQGTK